MLFPSPRYLGMIRIDTINHHHIFWWIETTKQIIPDSYPMIFHCLFDIYYIYIYATPYFVVWNPILGIDPNSAVDILPGPSGLVGGGPAVTEVPSVSRHAIERRSCGGSGDLEMNSSWWVQHGSALASTWLENPTKFGALWGKSSK